MKLSTKIYDENQIAFMTFDNILYQPAERIFIVPGKNQIYTKFIQYMMKLLKTK
jgi:hypothetical protein